MNRTAIIILGIILIGLVAADEVEQNDYIYFTCNNATDGTLFCSAATLDCYNSTDTKTVDGDSATNIATGKFKFQFTNTTDRYGCFIDCCTGAVDYAIPILVTTTPLIATDNIGINWADVSNPTTAVDLSATDIQLSDTCTAVTDAVVLPTTTETQIDDIEIDVTAILAGMITNHTALLTKINDVNESLQSYITANTSVILARGNSAWLTATGFETEAIAALRFVNLTDNVTVVITRGDSSWLTAAGFETETIAALRFVNLTDNATAIILYGANYWNSSNSSISGLATQLNLTDGIVVLTPATEARINYSMNGSLVDDIWDELLTGATHNVATSAGRRLRQIAGFAIRTETAQGGTNNTITLDAGASSTDGIYNRDLIVIVEGDGAGQTRIITEYDGTTKNATVNRNWKITPNETSVFQILANDVEGHPNHGYAQTGGSDNITLETGASSTDAVYVGDLIYISTGTGAQQARIITGYDGTTKVANVSPNWLVQPDATSLYHIDYQVRVQVDANYDKTDYTLTDGAEDELTDKIWDENSTDHILNGTFGGHLDANISRVTTELLAAISGLNNLSASEVENAVWDANSSDHTTENTTGYNQSKIGTASASIDNDAVAAAVWNYNISFGMQANNTLYTIYEVLVLTGFSSFAEALPEPMRTVTKMFLFGIEVQRVEFKRYQ